jgi:hypothetical protein
LPRDCGRHQGRSVRICLPAYAAASGCYVVAEGAFNVTAWLPRVVEDSSHARGLCAGLSGSRASPDVVALLTSREETAELLKMKQ